MKVIAAVCLSILLLALPAHAQDTRIPAPMPEATKTGDQSQPKRFRQSKRLAQHAHHLCQTHAGSCYVPYPGPCTCCWGHHCHHGHAH